jgi:hypothetical protein
MRLIFMSIGRKGVCSSCGTMSFADSEAFGARLRACVAGASVGAEVQVVVGGSACLPREIRPRGAAPCLGPSCFGPGRLGSRTVLQENAAAARGFGATLAAAARIHARSRSDSSKCNVSPTLTIMVNNWQQSWGHLRRSLPWSSPRPSGPSRRCSPRIPNL